MKKFVLVSSCLFFLFFTTLAQTTCALRISLLTCAPGQELYSTFGHTAIRVTDSTTGTDEVYNYGTFEFSPDFYYQFVKGKLLYALSVEDFQNFLLQYQFESRSILEQELLLDCSQKQQLYASLRTNALPENRFYRYDFLFDNCTTRAGEMILKNSGAPVQQQPLFSNEQPTFRNLVYVYLNRGHQDWSKLGIDLLLGARFDRRATNKEAQFLPDNLLMAFDSATINGHPLVKEETVLLDMPSPNAKSYLITPFGLFSFLLVTISILSFTKKKWAASLVRGFDLLLFFVLGCTGILLLFMWFGTDHQLCANNYNLFWAVPTHLMAAFFLLRKKPWIRTYFKLNFFLTVLLLLLWAFLPQQLNIALIPMILLIAFRSYLLSTKNHGNPRV